MVLPGLTLTATAHDAQGMAHTVSVEAFPPRPVVFDEVTEEKRLSDIIPDLICKIGGHALLVEIAVTHFVDETKREKVRAMGLACIEIDLSSIVAVWNWDSLKNAVIDGIAYKEWIANPRIDALRAELQRQAQEKAATADRDRLTVKRMGVPGLEAALKWVENFEKSGEAKREHDALNQAGPNHRMWLAAAEVMNLKWDDPPNYIDIPVPGENVFLVARKVWQAAAYLFILGNKEPIFSLKVALWCRSTFPVRDIIDLLAEHLELLTPSERAAMPSLHTAVHSYLTALVDLGYLKTKAPGDVLYYFQEGAPHTKG